MLVLSGFAFATVLATQAADNRVRIDNDQARVLVVSTEPDVKSPLHEHKMNRVMIYLDAGKMTLTDSNGKVDTLNFKAGEALWSPATGLHTGLNVSGHPVRVVEVELKSKPGGASTLKQSVMRRAVKWVRKNAPEFLPRMIDRRPSGCSAWTICELKTA